MGAERLQKVLARAGLGSRRDCEELIRSGRVSVNGKPAVLGMRADAETDQIALDGTEIPVSTDLHYFLLNKPAGYVVTARDPEGRPTVMDLVPSDDRVFPVGRLDFDSEGLLILTNDGDLSQMIAHPSAGLTKTYVVEAKGRLTNSSIEKLRSGIDLAEGTTLPAQVRVLSRHGRRSVLQITIRQGWNRQVRRMLEAVGLNTIRLARTAIGPVEDQKLKPGEWRSMSADEVLQLRIAAAD